MICCRNLYYVYPKSNAGLMDFSLSDTVFKAGSVCGLLGKNGAGKTTFLHVLIGALIPQSGTCTVHGFSTRKRDVRMLQDIAIIPEHCELPAVTQKIYERMWGPFYPLFDKELFQTLLQILGVPLNKLLTHMSFGQQKKFLLAFMIATKVKLLIFDEPTNGLDIPSKILFKQIIQKYRNEDQCILISTHQIKDIEGVIDSIVFIDEGQVMLHSSLQRIYDIFITEMQSEVSQDALFSVPVINGNMVLRTRKKDEKPTSVLDLEVFFSATVTDPKVVLNSIAIEESNANQLHKDELA